MAKSLLKPMARRLVNDLGIPASAQYQVKHALHRLGLYDDEQLEIFRRVEELVGNSRDWLNSLPENGAPSKKVLFWTVRGGLLINAIEALWGHALNAQGADSHFFICDKLLPACDHRTILSYPGQRVDTRASARLCDGCFFNAQGLLQRFALPVHTFGELATQEDQARARDLAAGLSPDQCFQYEYGGQPLGHIVYASVLRFLLRETLDDDPQTVRVIRDYLASAILMTDISRRALEKYQPDLVVTSHGIYVNWGVMTEVARQRGVPVVVWGLQYRKNTLTLSQNTTYHAEFRDEPTSVWDRRELQPDEEETIDRYLTSRRTTGAMDYITYHPNPNEDKAAIIAELGLDPSKKTVGLFANLIWDARVVFSHVVFPGMFQWVKETMDYYAKHPETQLIIRAHPAETKGRLPTLEKLGDQIARWYPALPENIRFIPPENDISSYTLGEMLDAALVYTSKIGLELSVQGVATIVAGDAFYARKGFTHDPTTPEEYFGLLDRIAEWNALPEETRQRAKKYAHHFFFRKMLPFNVIDNPEESRLSSITIKSLAELAPGRDPWLDLLVERSFSGEPFVVDLNAHRKALA